MSKHLSDSRHMHEPRFHIAKRDDMPFYMSWLIRIIAIIIAFGVSAFVIVLLVDKNPMEVFEAMIDGSFDTERKAWILLQRVAMLLCVSLAVTPAFKMRFWNIGAEGQALVGALGCAACMIYFGDSMPDWQLIPLMVVASVAMGMVWAIVPAYFKAKFDTNETLFTLMMNYIAMQLVSFCIVFWENPKGSNHVGVINAKTLGGWLPFVMNQRYLFNILVVAAITVIMYIYLKYSKQGYEITVVGESQNTARYIGINVKKVIIRTMAISGALCGIAGFLLVAGADHTITADTVGGRGFTAIMVSWLAKFNPLIMALVSFLIVFLERGAEQIATSCSIDKSIADIITGIILFFIIGSEFFVNYKIKMRKKNREEALA